MRKKERVCVVATFLSFCFARHRRALTYESMWRIDGKKGWKNNDRREELVCLFQNRNVLYCKRKF